ncbi:WYL domain-containing protein [Roseinatronobacter sp. S2]|uniref:WYL domain-containing protein n=1 Tax=Roseinatronobacter sp. S2 TaxID=3035471 RepID=UPI00358EBD26
MGIGQAGLARPPQAGDRLPTAGKNTWHPRRWPVAFGYFDHAELLAAWCEQRDDFRHFRIDRIENLALLDENIPRSRNSLLAAYRRIEPHANV